MSVTVKFDRDALECVGPAAITSLTEMATNATFYSAELTQPQLAANKRIVDISANCCSAASENPDQRYAAAFNNDRLIGYMIATRHSTDNLELDWLMVDPSYHGSGVSVVLLEEGIRWLGLDRPVWLSVIAYNARAIRFYQRYGFKVDPETTTSHLVPHMIMRRIPE